MSWICLWWFRPRATRLTPMAWCWVLWTVGRLLSMSWRTTRWKTVCAIRWAKCLSQVPAWGLPCSKRTKRTLLFIMSTPPYRAVGFLVGIPWRWIRGRESKLSRVPVQSKAWKLYLHLKTSGHRYSGFTLFIVPDRVLYEKYANLFSEGMSMEQKIDALYDLAVEKYNDNQSAEIFGWIRWIRLIRKARRTRSCIGTRIAWPILTTRWKSLWPTISWTVCLPARTSSSTVGASIRLMPVLRNG